MESKLSRARWAVGCRAITILALCLSLNLSLSGCAEPPQPVPLTNPTGWGTVPPIAGAVAQGDCREFQQMITINGEKHNAFGQACRQPDGTWKVVP